jgi:molybdopterin synthase catalytic subunit
MSPLSSIVVRPIDPSLLISAVSRPANGAVLLFLGVVREVNEGREVSGIDYAAYEGMAEQELQRIATEAAARFGSDDIAVEHRIGELGVEEVSVAIAVAHPHRDGAYALSRWMIEELKRRVPIWKREHYADGERAWVDPTAQRSAAAP